MTPGNYRRQGGMSYPEVVAAVLLLSIMLVPTMDALRAALRGSDIQVKNTIDHYLLIAKMEAVLARPYSELAALAGDESIATSLSDSVISSDGRSLQRQVFIAPHDADNADADDDLRTGTDAGIVWVKVSIANSNHSVQSLAIE